MKRSLQTLLICAFFLTGSINRTPPHGWYDEIFHVVHCDTAEECLHEQAHKMDQEFGYPTKSEDYKTVVQIYLRVAWLQRESLDNWQKFVVEFPGIGRPEITPFHTEETWGGYAELYAEMYRLAGGDIKNLPECFQKFYQEKK